MTQNATFPDFENLGNAVEYAEKIRQVVGHNALFDDFSVDDLKQLGPFMHVYRAPAHGILISEGERGDFMAFTIDGLIDVTKKDRWDVVKRIAVVQAGSALGEMSMIDGEARFATCVAAEHAGHPDRSSSEVAPGSAGGSADHDRKEPQECPACHSSCDFLRVDGIPRTE